MNVAKLTQRKNEDIETRRKIFKILAGILIALFLLYIYFVGSITFNILARKSLRITAKEVGNTVSEVELKYITLSNSINSQFGKDIGFIDAKNTIFVSRTDSRIALR